MFLNKALVAHKSKMQGSASLSMTKGELIAAFEAAQIMLFSMQVLEDIGLSEDMLRKFHGNRMLFPLGSAKGFLVGVDHRWFRNVDGDSHDEWGRVYVFVKKLEFEKHFLKFKIKIVSHDVRIAKIWRQTLMICISIKFYLIKKLLKILVYVTFVNVTTM